MWVIPHISSAHALVGILLLTGGCNATISEGIYSAGTDANADVDGGETPDASGDAAPAPDAPPPCVEGDVRDVDPVSGACYFAFLTPATFADAAASCATYGGTLAEIDDAAEQGSVRLMVADNIDPDLVPPRVDFWLGGSDVAVEGAWTWPSGTQFWSGIDQANGGMAVDGAYTNWRLVEPNNATTRDPNGENCMIIEADAALGTWDDRPCGDTYAYVCER